MHKMIILLLIPLSFCLAQLDLSPQNSTGAPGGTISVAFLLTNPAAAPIDAFGMKIHYPTNLVSYSSVIKTGTLTQDWIQVGANELQAGLLNLGAFHTTALTTSGVLFKIEFNIKPDAQGTGDISVTDFIDDLTGAQTRKAVITIAEQLTVLVPNGRESWAPGSMHLISWDAGALQDKIRCHYSIDGGTNWLPIADNLDNTGCYLWKLPAKVSTKTRVKVQSMISPQVADVSDADFYIGEPPLPCLFASSISGESGEKIVNIFINGNTKPIGAFGLKLTYDPTQLAFVQVDKSDLTKDWIQVSGLENSPGEITIGGFHTTPLPINSQGILAKVKFSVTCNGCTNCSQSHLVIANLIDDVQGMNVGYGVYSYVSACALGDVNMDGAITPADALCAFQIYMNGGAPTPGGKCDTECALFAADASCNGNITPDDALLIFKAYLNGATSMDCPQTAAKFTETNKKLIIEDIAVMPGQKVAVPILINNTIGLNAFGATMMFPAQMIDFVGFDRSDVTSGWFQLDAFEIEKGLIRIGGFDPNAIQSNEKSTLLTLYFVGKEKTGGCGEMLFVETVDAVLGAESSAASVRMNPLAQLPESFVLAQNFPNPFNMYTEILFQLTQAHFIELKVIDIHGRHVRTLLREKTDAGVHKIIWDGQSDQKNDLPSGIYCAVLTSGNQCTAIKMALIK